MEGDKLNFATLNSLVEKTENKQINSIPKCFEYILAKGQTL